MTTLLPTTTSSPSRNAPGGALACILEWLRRPLWNRFTPLQLAVLLLASLPVVAIVAVVAAALLGVVSTETMLTVALAAGEDPGMLVFGAMFLATPVRWVTARSQVRVRKHLGIVFFLLAVSNLAMFVVESGVAATLSAPFLVAGTIAVVLAAPLFMTSSRRAQRWMGMRRWRLLHRATYAIAVALVAHLVLVGEGGPAQLVLIGFVARLPVVRRRLEAIGHRRLARRRAQRRRDVADTGDRADRQAGGGSGGRPRP